MAAAQERNRLSPSCEGLLCEVRIAWVQGRGRGLGHELFWGLLEIALDGDGLRVGALNSTRYLCVYAPGRGEGIAKALRPVPPTLK